MAELLEAELRALLDRLEGASAALRARDPDELADSIARAWASIANPELALGRAARSELPRSTGLSLPMVAWALEAALAGAEEAIREAARRMRPPEGAIAAPPRLSVLVLAGNVFTACVQPWTLALLSRAPLLVKASSSDDVLPRLFHAALAEADPELADACAVVTFPGGTPALEATMLSRADVVSVYGSDSTIASIRARLGAGATLIAHGHGVGAGYVPREALADEESARRAADAFALDVAAYDQRGCMSPHVIWIERGAPVRGLELARMLARSLERVAAELPRGVLSTEAGAAQLQWRGVGVAHGVLIEGDGWAVSYEGESPLRISPGHRNVLVLDAEDDAGLARALAPLGVHLKCLGVAGDRDRREAVARALPAPLAPRVCEAGAMQRPSLLALADGRLPWEGLQRFVQVD